jgi:hypothetical protein
MGRSFRTILAGLCIAALAGRELLYAYRTGSVLIGRIHKRVYKGDRLGLFWFNVALMWIFFVSGILVVAWAIIEPSAFR